MKGKAAAGLPPRRGVRKGPYDWDDKARLAQKNPGVAVLAAEHVPESLTKSVRTYRNPPFVQTGGRIIVNVRNSALEPDGVRYGDVYFTWATDPTA